MNKLLFPILSIIAAVGLYFLYISPTYDEIKLHEAKQVEFEQAFFEIDQVRGKLESLESEYAGISREDLVRLEIFLPSKIDLPRTAQNFEKLLSDNKVIFSEIKLNPAQTFEEDSPKIRQHRVDIDVNVLYKDFLDILSDIESSLQHASINSISFGEEKRDNNGEVGDFVATTTPFGIGLTIYSFE
jgi:Tfp pilus assembly protein PilO